MKTFKEFVRTLQESTNEGPSDLVKKIAKTFKGSSIGRNQSLYADVKILR